MEHQGEHERGEVIGRADCFRVNGKELISTRLASRSVWAFWQVATSGGGAGRGCGSACALHSSPSYQQTARYSTSLVGDKSRKGTVVPQFGLWGKPVTLTWLDGPTRAHFINGMPFPKTEKAEEWYQCGVVEARRKSQDFDHNAYTQGFLEPAGVLGEGPRQVVGSYSSSNRRYHLYPVTGFQVAWVLTLVHEAASSTTRPWFRYRSTLPRLPV